MQRKLKDRNVIKATKLQLLKTAWNKTLGDLHYNNMTVNTSSNNKNRNNIRIIII